MVVILYWPQYVDKLVCCRPKRIQIKCLTSLFSMPKYTYPTQLTKQQLFEISHETGTEAMYWWTGSHQWIPAWKLLIQLQLWIHTELQRTHGPNIFKSFNVLHHTITVLMCMEVGMKLSIMVLMCMEVGMKLSIMVLMCMEVGMKFPHNGTHVYGSWYEIAHNGTHVYGSWYEIANNGTHVYGSWYEIAHNGTHVYGSWYEIANNGTHVYGSLYEIAHNGTHVYGSWYELPIMVLMCMEVGMKLPIMVLMCMEVGMKLPIMVLMCMEVGMKLSIMGLMCMEVEIAHNGTHVYGNYYEIAHNGTHMYGSWYEIAVTCIEFLTLVHFDKWYLDGILRMADKAPALDGILQKGPYPPCLRMADRALLQDTLDLWLSLLSVFSDCLPSLIFQPTVVVTWWHVAWNSGKLSMEISRGYVTLVNTMSGN